MKVCVETIESLSKQLSVRYHHVEGTTLTACWSFLPNGFAVGYGQSACISSELFDEDIGREIAYENCMKDSINKLWLLEGYSLKKEIQ